MAAKVITRYCFTFVQLILIQYSKLYFYYLQKTDEHTYMIPNVPYDRRHSEYMMASDLVHLTRSPPVGMSFGPKPTYHHHIFRNPSDRCDVKPTIPKSLPRALSAPPGRRPIVKRHPKPPRRHNLKFNNHRGPRAGFKATAFEDRPKV